MNKIWVFFKLRMLQFRYDKTALFFCYCLPVIMLTGIGYPIEMASKKSIELHYADHLNSNKSRALVNYLDNQQLVNVVSHNGEIGDFKNSLKSNEFSHFLSIGPIGAENSATEPNVFQGGELDVALYSDDTSEHLIQSMAIGNMLHKFFNAAKAQPFVEQHLQARPISSYIAILLPGLISMTMLTIGLGGFGAVLIGEFSSGIFKNIKTIDASPVPFLAGLFLSRIFACYTMAAALYIIGIFIFDLPDNIDFFIQLLIGKLLPFKH